MGIVSLIFPAPGDYGRIHSHNFYFDPFEFRDDPKLEPVSNGYKKSNMVEATIGGRTFCFARLFLCLPTQYT